MKKCKNCNIKFTPTNPKAHNIKFCSKECRESLYDLTMPSRQKEYRDQKNHERWNQFAPDKFQCPFCNGWYRALLHHVWQRHDMSEKEYKEYFGIDRKNSFIPQELKELKRIQVFENGTVRNLKKGTKTRFVKGDLRAGRYERSEQTLRRLKRIK